MKKFFLVVSIIFFSAMNVFAADDFYSSHNQYTTNSGYQWIEKNNTGGYADMNTGEQYVDMGNNHYMSGSGSQWIVPNNIGGYTDMNSGDYYTPLN